MQRSDRMPSHVAAIMDGNGRWARRRHRPRSFGHRAGVRAARGIVEACYQHGIEQLTLFAFSQENWYRPEAEIRLLVQLFMRTLQSQLRSLQKNGVRVRFIGDLDRFDPALRQKMREAEINTVGNERLLLNVAAGYGGQWDIAQAAQSLASEGSPITIEGIESRLCTAPSPHPDLLIRTGGEYRLSNFMLWQLDYTELYFTDTLWPDFDDAAFEKALDWYSRRERRFGRVSPVAE